MSKADQPRATKSEKETWLTIWTSCGVIHRRMLITYLVPTLEGAGEHIKAEKSGKSLLAKGLVAARHIKADISVPGPPIAGKGRISFNHYTDDSQYWQAFRVPLPGTHIEYTGDISQEFLAFWGIDMPPSSVYGLETWLTAQIDTVSLDLAAQELGLKLDAAAAFIEWSDGRVKLEIWEKQTTRNEIISNAEVGILKIDDMSEPDDIVLMGRYRNVPYDEQSSPVMFHQVHVWRPLNDSVVASLSKGLHPDLTLSVASKPPAETCMLYVNLELPPAVFVDRYQLEDLPAKEPPSELMGVWGSTDLEAPVWLVDTASQALIRLDVDKDAKFVTNYSIPLHLRYEIPGSLENRSIPAPQVFWACKDDIKHDQWAIETFFPKGTAFYPLRSESITFNIPTIDPADHHFVELATAFVVMLGSLAIIWRLLKATTTTATTTLKTNKIDKLN